MLKSDIATGTATLTNAGWLSRTPLEFSDAILSNCHWRTVAAGAAIQHAGDPITAIGGVARGTISMTTALGSPDTPMVHILHSGMWYGYVPLFTGAPLPNGIMARSDVLIATLARAQLEAILAQRPEWWRYVGLLGIIYASTATNIAADLMIRDSARRCAAALLHLGDCRFTTPPGGQQIEAPLSQDELAAISNLSRTSVSTILRDLEDGGYIKLGYRSVTISDPTRLRSMVDDV